VGAKTRAPGYEQKALLALDTIDFLY